jgi:hypothetical protein
VRKVNSRARGRTGKGGCLLSHTHRAGVGGSNAARRKGVRGNINHPVRRGSYNVCPRSPGATARGLKVDLYGISSARSAGQVDGDILGRRERHDEADGVPLTEGTPPVFDAEGIHNQGHRSSINRKGKPPLGGTQTRETEGVTVSPKPSRLCKVGEKALNIGQLPKQESWGTNKITQR